MPSRQEIRSEETKRAIVSAAGNLFAERGYDQVTMREIAKAAGCSHTTIYIYFKDKEALLHQLAMGPLQSLYEQLQLAVDNEQLLVEQRLKLFTRKFLEFCLGNRTMTTVFFMTKATRVDEEKPELEINQLRNQMFGLLRRAIQACLQADQRTDALVLAYARIYYYTLQGILATYPGSDEPLNELMDRLLPTFNLAVDVLLAGFKQVQNKGEIVDEN